MVTCGSESRETPRLSRYKKKLARGEIPLAGMEPQLKSEVLSTEPEHCRGGAIAERTKKFQ